MVSLCESGRFSSSDLTAGPHWVFLLRNNRENVRLPFDFY